MVETVVVCWRRVNSVAGLLDPLCDVIDHRKIFFGGDGLQIVEQVSREIDKVLCCVTIIRVVG